MTNPAPGWYLVQTISDDPTVAQIAAGLFNVPTKAILGRGREKRLAEARAAVYYAMYDVGLSKSEVGRQMDRHYTGVMKGILRAEYLSGIDRDYRIRLRELCVAARGKV